MKLKNLPLLLSVSYGSQNKRMFFCLNYTVPSSYDVAYSQDYHNFKLHKLQYDNMVFVRDNLRQIVRELLLSGSWYSVNEKLW